MQLFDPKQLDNYPVKPGVYLMKNSADKVLYVGKAKNLRQRLRQYFVKKGDGRLMVPFLIEKVSRIDVMVVTSEKEALIVENNFIKQYWPSYNVLLKDDKSFIALRLTNHQWPRLDLIRYRGQPKKDGIYFGPYANAGAARATLELLQKIFPLRQCSDQEFARRTRPCILYDIKRCIAPCVGKCTPQEYADQVEGVIKFLRGQDREILRSLEAQRQRYADALEFESAAAVHKTIRQIKQTFEPQYVDRPLGVDTDVLGLYRQAEEVAISQLFVRKGRLTGSSDYSFSQIAQEDAGLLTTFIFQRYEQAEDFPKQILVPAVLPDAKLIEEWLLEKSGRRVQILAPQKGASRTLLEMGIANAEAGFKKERDAKAILEKTLLELQEKLRLVHYPAHIECFDNSNLGGEEPVSALVAFTDGKPDKRLYRTFCIKQADGSDDYGALFEVLMRHYQKAKKAEELPNLIIVDGGKGHLNVALKVMAQLNIVSVDLIAIAKEKGRHDRGATQEQIFLPNIKDPILLRSTSSVLFFLQRIRDETHRFVIGFQKKRRKKRLITSALDAIPGIGEVKRSRLLRHFGSVKRIREASDEELLAVKGISKRDVQAIQKF